MLELDGVCAGYGDREVLHGVSLVVLPGAIVALLGANGAGKSTVLRAISGLATVSGGSIRLGGRDLAPIPPHERVRLGLGHVPEGRRIFPRLSVRENLLMGAFLTTDAAEISRRRERVDALFPVLRERDLQPGGLLSGGEQQMLAIGRALMGAPAVLLLDEPSLGLAPLMVARIFGVIREIHAQGCTIVLVEQNARQALRIASSAHVLETGRVTLQGDAGDLARDPRVRVAYLGG